VLSRSLWSRAATVLGLVGLAWTQPLLDLMGHNPEFFIEGRYTTAQIVQFAIAVVLVPAVGLLVVVVVTSWVHGGLGDLVYQGVLLVLGALFGGALARTFGLDGNLAPVALSLAGAAAALALVRVSPGRTFLELLAVANVLFLVGFLLISPTSRLLDGATAGELGSVRMPTPPGPVVVIVFDELPISTLLTVDGEVNDQRFPGFARLADTSTWYRNASSDHNRTEVAVPQLLTGTLPPRDALPSYLDLPRNLLTMFATKVPVHRYEAITDLCPPSLCEAQPPEPLDRALRDAAVVYGHRVLPTGLRGGLPAIDQGWGGFGEATTAAAAPTSDEGRAVFDTGRLARWANRSGAEKSPAGQAATLEAQMAEVGPEPALHFAHVVLPHAPWTISPWGPALIGGPPGRIEDPSDPAYERSSLLHYQRHSLQVGAADAILVEVLDHLEASPAWLDTTLVVVADHGTSTLPPDFGREPTDRNRQEIYRIPMFIKVPGQSAGEVVDTSAQAIDVVPTLADLLDVDLDWAFDGHSLLDGSEATVEPVVGEALAPLFEVVRRHDAQVPSDGDWVALAAVGEHAGLVGRPVAAAALGSPSEMTWQPDHEDELGTLPTSDGGMPQVLRGTVSTPDGARPPEIVVAVNGTIAGTLGGYRADGHAWRFASVLGPFLVEGANEIVAYEVDGLVLRRLG
jgi:hypothetical protein